MRSIAGYDEIVARPGRRAALQVTVTPPGGSAMDITDLVKSVMVTDNLSGDPSTAEVALSRSRQSWNDPLGTGSPLAPGGRMAVKMGETGGSLVTVFDGEIATGSTSADSPVARTRLQAVGGYRAWWSRQVTSPGYTAQTRDAIVQDLFQRFGGLSAGDFDLPGGTETLAYLQVMGRPIMEAARDIYAPAERVPWWDPGQGKLSTLSLAIPDAADLVVPVTLRGRCELQWTVPEATRVLVQGGSVRDLVRIEIGEWPLPDRYQTGNPGLIYQDPPAGVRWASGNKSDNVEPPSPYWADANDTPESRHWDSYNEGDYLWVQLYGEYSPDVGTGYRGPDGVRFLINDDGSSVSLVEITEYPGDPSGAQGYVVEERWNADARCQSCQSSSE